MPVRMVFILRFCGKVQAVQGKRARGYIYQRFQGIGKNGVGAREQPRYKFYARQHNCNREQKSLYAKITFDGVFFMQ